jgi:hypothetical protein
MTARYAWQEPYFAAMLELDPGKVRQRITEAQEAIARRLEEVRDGGWESDEERNVLSDAQQNLRALIRTLEQSSREPGE